MKMLKYFLLLFVLHYAKGIPIYCSFQTVSLSDSATLYYCEIQDKGKYIEPKIVFDEIAGIHAVGKSNEDVQGFRFEHYDKIQYFPINLENFFKNLTSISLHDLEIKEIHQSDLEPFGNLKYFYFGKNQLHTLEKDLFEFNPLLELLWLNNNKLSHIDPFVFSSLNSLRVLDLSFNSCKKSFSKVATKELVRTTIRDIEHFQCFSIDFFVISNNENFTRQFDAINEKLENLLKNNQNLNYKGENFYNVNYSVSSQETFAYQQTQNYNEIDAKMNLLMIILILTLVISIIISIVLFYIVIKKKDKNYENIAMI